MKRITRFTAAAALAAACLLATAPVRADEIAAGDDGSAATTGSAAGTTGTTVAPPTDYGWKKLLDYGLCAMSVAGSLIPPTSVPSMLAAGALCGRLFEDEDGWLPR